MIGLRVRAQAPAKVNRELRVGARRPDGFHEVFSRFTSIDLADAIEVEPWDALELDCTGLPVPTDGENLVLQAARALADSLSIEPRARIRLEKRIPVGAGLGGGSSDAAAALRLLRRLWKPDLPDEALASLAPALGSDVPYFLVGGEADVAGRGERVTRRGGGAGEWTCPRASSPDTAVSHVHSRCLRRARSEERRTRAHPGAPGGRGVGAILRSK